MENSAQNRKQLDLLEISFHGNDDSQPSSSSVEDGARRESCYGNHATVRALVHLFLRHYSKAESANIEVRPPPLAVSAHTLTPSPTIIPLSDVAYVCTCISPHLTCKNNN